MITDTYIESLIAKEQYHIFPGTTVTVCCLTLKNDFSVIGESACLPTTEFKEETGRHFAREKAKDKIWDLVGYEERTRLKKDQPKPLTSSYMRAGSFG